MNTRSTYDSLNGGPEYYRNFEIQPVEFIVKNKIPFCEGNVIKYVCRWRRKGGSKDLLKAKHYIDLLLELTAEEHSVEEGPHGGQDLETSREKSVSVF